MPLEWFGPAGSFRVWLAAGPGLWAYAIGWNDLRGVFELRLARGPGRAKPFLGEYPSLEAAQAAAAAHADGVAAGEVALP